MSASPGPLLVSYADVAAAAQRLAGHAHRTPVLTSRQVDERTACRVFFKCENFQRVGAFKFRGAYNKIAQLTETQRLRGVIAHSSGNHAQGVALAATMLGLPSTIVMPEETPIIKVDRTRAHGAEVVLHGTTFEDAFKKASDDPEFLEIMNNIYIPPAYKTPEDYKNLVEVGYKESEVMIRELGLHKSQQKK